MYTFEEIFLADGDIVFQYASMEGELQSNTLGIENSDGSIGLQIVHNAAYVANQLAVKIIPPVLWLSVDPMSGMNFPDESSDFTVTFDASELEIGTYTGYLRIDSNDPDDPIVAVECTLLVDIPIGLDDEISRIPSRFSLSQNYPNPFNPSTRISFDLPSDQQVSLRIYDLLGREVTTVLDKHMLAGFHRVEFDGSSMASGVYFYILKAGDFADSKRMVLIK